MSFQQGLSGLNAAAMSLDVIGNNIANSTSTGFKQGVVGFGDVFAASAAASSGSANAVGIGTKITGVNQQFTQGKITVTNNPLDVAINGQGFFVMSKLSDKGTVATSYTRNGEFALDSAGWIVSSSGQHLTGMMAEKGVLKQGDPENLRISSSTVPPQPTSSALVGANLDSTSKVIAPQVPPVAFDPADSSKYNFSTTSYCFDGAGTSHNVTYFFTKTDVNQWEINTYAVVDDPANPGKTMLIEATGSGVDAGGAATTGPTVLKFSIGGDQTAVATNLTKTVNISSIETLSIDMDFSKMTQYATGFSVTDLTQNGYASGALVGYNITDKGVIEGRYTNGQTQTLGQIKLASFTNPQGLKPAGNGTWEATLSAGPVIPGFPGDASMGLLQSQAKEDSNVDLTAELVNMITAQRVYQANAQSIKTQDQVLQTMVSMK